MGMTIGEKYGPAMEMTNQAEADEWFEKLVQDNMSYGTHTRKEAECIERANLGYYASYYNSETRDRVERLFTCAHPVFGAIAEHGQPSAEQSFLVGVALANRKDG